MRDFSRLGIQFGEHVQKVTAELLLGETPKSASEIERCTRQTGWPSRGKSPHQRVSGGSMGRWTRPQCTPVSAGTRKTEGGAT